MNATTNRETGVVISLVGDDCHEGFADIASSYGFGYLNYYQNILSQPEIETHSSRDDHLNTCVIDIVTWMGSFVKKMHPHLQPIGVIASPKRLLQMKAFFPIAPLRNSVYKKFFIPIDISSEQGKDMNMHLDVVDLLLIKYSDFIQHVAWDDENHFIMSRPMTSFLHAYRDKSESIPCIDTLEAVKPLFDRRSMCMLLDEIAKVARMKKALPVRSANWEMLSDAERIVNRLSYPYILKSRLACGIPDSHVMALILGPEGTRDCELAGPLVAQEYINHGGILYKVYMIGSNVLVEKRDSMPDIYVRGAKNDALPSCIEFDSLHSLPTRLPWLYQDTASDDNKTPSFRILTDHFFQTLGNIVREHLPLSVFGFDVVFDHQAGEALLIDINYFPSFGSISDAPSHFIETFLV